MFIGKSRRGDTIVEVVLAFAVFTLVAVGTNALMNRGVSLAEQSLEITLVRAQIDAQAELLRYAQSVNSDAWQDIKTHVDEAVDGGATDILPSDLPDVSEFTECPSTAPQYSFMLGAPGKVLTFYRLDTIPPIPSPYKPATVHSQFYPSSATPTFSGIWVIPIIAEETTSTIAYDMHIGTCWNVPGADRPFTLSTIVRLYDAS